MASPLPSSKNGHNAMKKQDHISESQFEEEAQDLEKYG